MGYDVVVVGAGVAGCFISYQLAKNGFKVALLDRKPEERIGEKVCGDGVGSHHFPRIGIEEPRVGVDATLIFRGVKVYAPDEQSFITVPGKGYSLDRRKFGQRLLKIALDAGAELYDETCAAKPIVEESWIRGVEVLEKGYRREFYAKAVVDASGAIPAIRLKLPSEWWASEKIPREDYTICYREILKIDGEVNEDYALIYLNSKIAPGGYWWLFPKGGNVVNVGLGVQWGRDAPSPKKLFDEYLRSRFKIVEILHGGGGIVPCRRAISCMVWNGFIAVGDAACTTNPIHGGGIGPSMLSAKLAAETLKEAFERGAASLGNLWRYNRRFMEAYGAKQAALDVLRIYLQRLEDRDFNFLIGRRLISGSELENVAREGKVADRILTGISALVKLVSRPSLLAKISILKFYMEKAKRHYLNYPTSPDTFERWKREGEAIFENFKKLL